MHPDDELPLQPNLLVQFSLWALGNRQEWGNQSEQALTSAVQLDIHDAAYRAGMLASPADEPPDPIPHDVAMLSHDITAPAYRAAAEIQQAAEDLEAADSQLQQAELRAKQIEAEPETHPVHAAIANVLLYTGFRANQLIEQHEANGNPGGATHIRELLETSAPHTDLIDSALHTSATMQVNAAQEHVIDTEVATLERTETARQQLATAALCAVEVASTLIDEGTVYGFL